MRIKSYTRVVYYLTWLVKKLRKKIYIHDMREKLYSNSVVNKIDPQNINHPTTAKYGVMNLYQQEIELKVWINTKILIIYQLMSGATLRFQEYFCWKIT